ncbi:hypothetical protein A8C32_15925 [Flavivirga aquatica]|uniref:3-keto-alpha-glucoside-1,2-lyase/3-keto-2-hydroxy-glucal hydratase domain-containing protein n=1 Tax=Flavivirga aquatica TaxID=1849968 RepID=A0A1E5T9M7_9FLAO|nr:hypothetical protein A8C32_15925 [Flavivirga aquatica]
MKEFKLLALIILLISFLSCKDNNKKKPEIKEKWVQLFNGKDLNNWVIKIKGHPAGENYKNTFIVEDGVLKVNYNEYEAFDNAFGHIFYNKIFSNYRIRLQYRFTGEQLKRAPDWAINNSGVMIHCEDPKSMEINQKFPVCIEAQLLGGLGQEERATGNLCTPGSAVLVNDSLITRPCFQSSSKTFHGDQWVTFEAEVRNDSIIKHFVNGKHVLTYSKPIVDGGMPNKDEFWKSKMGTPLKDGYISLQSESTPMEFKNIEILELN